MRGGLVPRLGLLLIGTVFSLGVGEFAVRLYSASGSPIGARLAAWDPMHVLIEPHGQLGYRQRPNSTYRYPNGTAAHSNAQGFRGPTVVVPKPAGVFRIVLLGGSTTHGWGVNDSGTVDRYLRDSLALRYPTRRIEVVNLAFDGYDSYQLWERMQSEAIAYQPDLVIVNSGINDVRNARFQDLQPVDRRTLIWETDLRRLRAERAHGGPTLYTRVKHWFYLARLPGFLRQQVVQRVEEEAAPPPVPNEQAVGQFEGHIAAILDLAAARGIPVILSTPPSALRLNYSPSSTSTISYWIRDAATTQAVRDSLAARLQRLATRAAAGGRAVVYVVHHFPGTVFIDDAHLTPAGNARLAGDFASAISHYLGPAHHAPGTQ